MSLFAYVREEQESGWSEHLCKNARADFIQGKNFIVNNEEMIFQQE